MLLMPPSSISTATAVSTSPMSRSKARTARSPSSRCKRPAASSTSVVTTMAPLSAAAHIPSWLGSRDPISMREHHSQRDEKQNHSARDRQRGFRQVHQVQKGMTAEQKYQQYRIRD